MKSWWHREPLWERMGDSSSERAQAVLEELTPVDVRRELLEDPAVLRRLALHEDLEDLDGEVITALLASQDLVALAALARPGAPLHLLEALPARLVGDEVLAEHYRGGELEALVALRGSWPGSLAELVLTAEALEG